ncbi:antibiotic biosynthesis monooxygenase family protein [Yersinia sp. 2540 StPb PI]|uniref:antibiotic biosynthesis monooxygenase family protein n=1 Tax=Yersinia sp. 2540 StPb PI TaxID=3117406 RepID=UPI003FA4493D
MSLFLSSFIFEKKEYDDEFYILDKGIEDYTTSIPGFIGMESYTDATSGRIINNYYWQSRSAMESLITHIAHTRAKSLSDRWIFGYQTVIAEIEGTHNMNLSHPLANYPLPYRSGKESRPT